MATRSKRKTKAKAKSKRKTKAKVKSKRRSTSRGGSRKTKTKSRATSRGSRGGSTGRSRKPRGSRTVDFKGVEGDSPALEPGRYPVKVKKVEIKTGKESGEEYYNWEFRTVTGKKKTNDKPLWFVTSLQPSALFNLRGLLETLQLEVPEGPYDIVPSELVGLECIAVVEHEKYEGRTRARMTDYLPSDYDEEDEEDEEDVDVEDDLEEDDEEEEGDEDEEEDDEEEEGDEDEEEDDEDEEELEALTESEVFEKSAKELKEVVETYELDVDLAEHKTLGKKRSAVLDALEEEGYIEEEDEDDED